MDFNPKAKTNIFLEELATCKHFENKLIFILAFCICLVKINMTTVVRKSSFSLHVLVWKIDLMT